MPGLANRRRLTFTSLDEALADADRLATAEGNGTLRHVGNWDLGQTLGHLALWTEFAFDGYPPDVRAPLPVRLLLRMMRGTILKRGMMTGVKIGRVPGGTLGMEKIATAIALDRLTTVWQKLKVAAPAHVNPVFGKLSHAQWIQLNLRHAELHLGFQIAGD